MPTCLICNEDFKIVTNTHLSKHNLTVKEYLEIPNAILKIEMLKKTKCSNCKEIIYRKRIRKNQLCNICFSEFEIERLHGVYLRRNREANGLPTLTAKDENLLTDEDFHKNLKKLDFIPGKKGFQRIGTFQEDELDVIIVNGQQRIKGKIKLEELMKDV